MRETISASRALEIQPTPNDGVKKHRFSVSRTAGTMPVYRPAVQTALFAIEPAAGPTASIKSSTPNFKDLLDVINPLQHLPIISSLYRNMTGDEISAPARFIGATIYGGPIGGALSLADTAIKDQTGSTMEEKAFRLVNNNTENKTASIETITYPSRHKEPTRTAGTLPIWNNTIEPTMKLTLNEATQPIS